MRSAADASRRLLEKRYRRINSLHFGPVRNRVGNTKLVGKRSFSAYRPIETLFIQRGSIECDFKRVSYRFATVVSSFMDIVAERLG